jgi:hypothetical protein
MSPTSWKRETVTLQQIFKGGEVQRTQAVVELK